MHVGVPAVPVSPAYSLLAQDHAQLRYIAGLTRPGLVYAADGDRFAKALAAVAAVVPDAEIVTGAGFGGSGAGACSTGTGAGAGAGTCPTTSALRVGRTGPSNCMDTAVSAGRSGGSRTWKRMPPARAPGSPTSSTNRCGAGWRSINRAGSRSDADQAPAIEATVRNLREVPSTLHFNVPRGFEMLIPFLERDAGLRETFFRDLDGSFYAAAALPQHLWEKLENLSILATGRRVVMLSAWGSTETAPSSTQIHFLIERAGVIGVPGAGTEIKLAPVEQKLELRVKGPNVTPGYWRHPELTAGLFDEDGFLKTGDAGKLADPRDPNRGILFDGRLAENFKLMSGTWVHVGELRLELISAGAPVIQDVVVTGHDREEIGLLIFPNPAGCRSLCRDAAETEPLAELIRRPEVRDHLAAALAAHNAANPANSRRIARALLVEEPPSIEAGEVTDKGYVNQRAVLARRAVVVERLYEGGAAGERIVMLA